MALQIASLNSGSNGNAYYVGNQTEAILVDAGLSCKEMESRMQAIGLSMQKVKALFISHEHTDHIKGVDVLAKKYLLPVYISKGTYNNSRLRLPASQLHWLSDNTTTTISGLNIKAFSKRHDAKEPYSFTVEHNNITVGVFTDIGIACDNIIYHFKKCHAAFLESNYDEDMLQNGRYPWVLKRRITSGHGHLSNKQALDIFVNHRSEFMSHLLLSHLSRDNNDPQLVQDLFNKHAGKTTIVVASRYEASPLFQISNHSINSTILPQPVLVKALQMNLFG